MLIRLLRGADLGVEMVGSNYVEVAQHGEEVAGTASTPTQVFLEKQVAHEEHALGVAPVSQLLVVGLLIALAQRAPEIIAHLGGLLAHVCIEGGKPGLQIIAIVFSEEPEHIRGPRDDVVVLADGVVVHCRLISVKALDDRAHEFGMGLGI